MDGTEIKITDNDVVEIDNSKFVHHAEMSYHKDGSFLHKIKDRDKAEYSNPYGEGKRWVATNDILDFDQTSTYDLISCNHDVINMLPTLEKWDLKIITKKKVKIILYGFQCF